MCGGRKAVAWAELGLNPSSGACRLYALKHVIGHL